MPVWIWCAFIFAFGCCIGSFLNVVVYRLPRDKSLVLPPSACPACKKNIRFYDNIPLLSWLLLGGKCRNCKAAISVRYFIVELLTGTLFAGLFLIYSQTGIRPSMGWLADGRWFVYLLHIILLGAFIAASAIDLEYWVIPLSVCWFVTAAGLIGSAVGVYVIDPEVIQGDKLLPWSSAATAAMAVGSGIGLGVSWLLVVTGVLKRSYEPGQTAKSPDTAPKNAPEDNNPPYQADDPNFNHRAESFREILFLLPIVACTIATYRIASTLIPVETWRSFPAQHPAVSGLLGSLFGYFAGCALVWSVRILGTLGFGKEAMGLGDVHLMGAAGAVIGPLPVVIAFFIAPFFGLAWVGCQIFFKKIRQIPYGPFLSLGILVVMIFNDWIMNRLGLLFYR